jgi:hypothetical protein
MPSASGFYALHFGTPTVASREAICTLLSEAANEVEDHGFSHRFLLGEWEDVVDAWQLDSWEAYRDVRRLGRKTRLPERKRALLWSMFKRVRQRLADQGMITNAAMFSVLSVILKERKNPPFEFAVNRRSARHQRAATLFLGGAGRRATKRPLFCR